MDRNTDERLSAFIDSEMSEFENRRFTPQMIEDEESRSTLARYQLIGDVMRAEEGTQVVRPNLVDAISSRLADEPTVLAPQRPATPTWVKAASGLAIAASVAMVAVLLAPKMLYSPESAPAQPAIASVSVQKSDGTRWKTVKPEVEQKLNQYLVNHGEFVSRGGMNRMLPYASFVTYDSAR